MNTEDMLTLIISSQKIYRLYGLKHHIVEMRRGVTDAGQRTNEQTLKIELLSQWKLEAEFRKNCFNHVMPSWNFFYFFFVGFCSLMEAG